MGSVMDSRYWTCPSCFSQFDWNDGSAQGHDAQVCETAGQQQKRQKVADVAEEQDGSANGEASAADPKGRRRP